MGTKYPGSKSRDIVIYKKILLQSLFDSNSQVNGHTDHGGARGALPDGRYSDPSEWPRSVSDAGGNTKESTGHRNRGSNIYIATQIRNLLAGCNLAPW